MIAPPETFRIASRRVACDGSGEVLAALGHPRVWLEIDEKGYTECSYCDRRFVLIGSIADIGEDKGAQTA
jgi:NADH dehydrogenase (ubiquinone) Fe-S protein 6